MISGRNRPPAQITFFRAGSSSGQENSARPRAKGGTSGRKVDSVSAIVRNSDLGSTPPVRTSGVPIASPYARHLDRTLVNWLFTDGHCISAPREEYFRDEYFGLGDYMQ